MPTDHIPEAPAGLFATLLDRRFDILITPRLLRTLYTLTLACLTGINLVFFWFGWSLTGAGPFWRDLGWLVVIGTPPAWLAELIVVRVVVEYLIVQHKISADLTIIRRAVADDPTFRRATGQLPARDDSGEQRTS